jgi:hypothetical protein
MRLAIAVLALVLMTFAPAWAQVIEPAQTISADGQLVCWPVADADSVTLTSTGTWAGTLEARVRTTHGSETQAQTQAGSWVANGVVRLQNEGYVQVCVRSTAWTSGSVTLTATRGAGLAPVAGLTTADLPLTVEESDGGAPASPKYVELVSAGALVPIGVLDPCQKVAKSYITINQTAGTQLVTGEAAKRVYVCSIQLVTATAQNVALVNGTGTVCATGTAGVMGGPAAATGWNFAANGGLGHGMGGFAVARTTADAANLCLLQSGVGQVSGSLAYVVQ